MNKHLDSTTAEKRPVPCRIEEPWNKVRRLAAELSMALLDADSGNWYAKVYPKNPARGWSILYIDIQSEDEAHLRIEPKLLALIENHKQAREKYDTVCEASGLKNDIATQELQCSAKELELEALKALLNYVPFNDVSRYIKAKHFTPLPDAQLDAEDIDVLLTSMCGRCA